MENQVIAQGEYVYVELIDGNEGGFKVVNEGSVLKGKIISVGPDIDEVKAGDIITFRADKVYKSTGKDVYIKKKHIFSKIENA